MAASKSNRLKQLPSKAAMQQKTAGSHSSIGETFNRPGAQLCPARRERPVISHSNDLSPQVWLKQLPTNQVKTSRPRPSAPSRRRRRLRNLRRSGTQTQFSQACFALSGTEKLQSTLRRRGTKQHSFISELLTSTCPTIRRQGLTVESMRIAVRCIAWEVAEHCKNYYPKP